MEEGIEEARRNFRLAMTLVDDDTDPKLVNEVRYFLCWLYWENEDYYRAAVLGEFLARRYPDHPAASAAAKLSMASFERLYRRRPLPAADKKPRISRPVTWPRWPSSSRAAGPTRPMPTPPTACSSATRFATGRIEDAQKMLGEARPNRRAAARVATWQCDVGTLSSNCAQPAADKRSGRRAHSTS